MPIDESTISVVSGLKNKPTTGLYPAAPTPDYNPGQNAGSGMAGSGNHVQGSIPTNECCSPDSSKGCSTFGLDSGHTAGQHRLNTK